MHPPPRVSQVLFFPDVRVARAQISQGFSSTVKQNGGSIKEVLYLCQKPFLLFASSTAPETYKSINYSGGCFSSLLGFELFTRILRLSRRTSASDRFFLTSAPILLSFVYLLFYIHLCECVWARLSASLSLCLRVFRPLMFPLSPDAQATPWKSSFCVFVSRCGFRFEGRHSAKFHCSALTLRAMKCFA